MLPLLGAVAFDDNDDDDGADFDKDELLVGARTLRTVKHTNKRANKLSLLCILKSVVRTNYITNKRPPQIRIRRRFGMAYPYIRSLHAGRMNFSTLGWLTHSSSMSGILMILAINS